MAAIHDLRRWLMGAALACLVSESGCARYRDWVWNTSGARSSPGVGTQTRDEVRDVNGLHEAVFGNKKGLIDPDQPH